MSPITDYLVEAGTTLIAVIVVGALVVFSTRRLTPPSGPLKLVGHLPLGARRAVYLVRVGERVFVLGGSEAGLATLGEMPATSVPLSPHPGGQSFRQFWSQMKRSPTVELASPTDPVHSAHKPQEERP